MTRPAYHHGELRAALIAAALRVLEGEGPQALSLRRLARETGVSAMAPYHHFAGRAELLAAVAAEGFRRLQAEKTGVLALAEHDPGAALVAGSAGYVAFVLANPNLYRLMKGADFADASASAELSAAVAAPAESLRGLIRRLCPADADAAIEAKGKVMWGLAHGLALLALDRQLVEAEALALARQGAQALVAAWAARG
ncbi:TetR/AcrR family transcriptional regulator [Sphingomonas sp.]|uniref:TetR/AcrR family transcriptional regulator n=1 Tax=Sphingomonas sp. TaxID=28214 RepID=UPI001D3FDF27|nr:TetR family transcriptional regulator [Sphingomonas sp.]MBX9797372.1 TetR family transcriptional regulator [Sphingomonas sp.]